MTVISNMNELCPSQGIQSAEDPAYEVVPAVDAMSDQEDEQAWEHDPVFADLLFRQKRKKGAWRVVPAPDYLDSWVADIHCHLDMLASPSLNLARCAFYGLPFVIHVADPSDCADFDFASLEAWRQEAAQNLLPMLRATLEYLSQPEVDEQLRLSYEAWGVCEEVALALEHALTDGSIDLLVREDLARRAEIGGQKKACPRTGVQGFIDELAIPLVGVSVGCHPHNARHYNEAMHKRIVEALSKDSVCAVGEIGLDYHYDNSPRDVQQEVFRRQIRLAHEYGLPVVLHLRSAHDDALRILHQEGFPEAGTILHCFTLGPDKAQLWRDEDCVLSFGGALTFKRFDPLRESCAQSPNLYMVTETDAPFMTPEPMRGCDCGPEHSLYTAAMMKRVKEACAQDVISQKNHVQDATGQAVAGELHLGQVACNQEKVCASASDQASSVLAQVFANAWQLLGRHIGAKE